jgi:hypothetical protein
MYNAKPGHLFCYMLTVNEHWVFIPAKIPVWRFGLIKRIPVFYYTRPSIIATFTNPAVFFTSSFCNKLLRWFSTVRRLR